MKKILYLIVFFLVIGIVPVSAKEKVKVYIFEAGGCPYCEAALEQLKELQETNDHFEIVEKELYVDHINWEYGKDIELGINVVEAFQESGFTDLAYNSVPLVIISDLYARNGLGGDFIDLVNDAVEEAYEEGDMDIVGCIEKGEKCEVRVLLSQSERKAFDKVNSKIKKVDNSNTKHHAIMYCLIGILAVYSIVLTMKVYNLSNPKQTTKKEIIPEHKKEIEKEVKDVDLKQKITKSKTKKK